MKTDFKNFNKLSSQSLKYVPFSIKENFTSNFCSNKQFQVPNENSKVKVKGYLTPNYFNSKYSHCLQKNQKIINQQNNVILQTKKSNKLERLIFSNQKNQFSVKNNKEIKNNWQYQESSNKFIPKFKFYRQQKIQNLIQQQFKYIKNIDLQFFQLDETADIQIEQIDKLGKKLMKQLHNKFNDVIKFLNWQKQNCIQLILQKLDQLKQPLQSLKANINKDRWSLDTIESKLTLIQSQQIKYSKQFIGKTVSSYNEKIDIILKNKQNYSKLLDKAKDYNKKSSSQQMGSVQRIVQIVYKIFFANSFIQQKNQENQQIKRDFVQSQKLYYDLISSIKKKSQQSPSINNSRSLYEQLKTIQNTFNLKEYEEVSLNKILEKQSFQQIKNERNEWNFPLFAGKRPSQTTNFSSVTNLKA